MNDTSSTVTPAPATREQAAAPPPPKRQAEPRPHPIQPAERRQPPLSVTLHQNDPRGVGATLLLSLFDSDAVAEARQAAKADAEGRLAAAVADGRAALERHPAFIEAEKLRAKKSALENEVGRQEAAAKDADRAISQDADDGDDGGDFDPARVLGRAARAGESRVLAEAAASALAIYEKKLKAAEARLDEARGEIAEGMRLRLLVALPEADKILAEAAEALGAAVVRQQALRDMAVWNDAAKLARRLW